MFVKNIFRLLCYNNLRKLIKILQKLFYLIYEMKQSYIYYSQISCTRKIFPTVLQFSYPIMHSKRC